MRQKPTIIFKGRGSGSTFDLGGLCVLFQQTQSTELIPEKIEKPKPIQTPTRQQIAQAQTEAKRLVSDYTEEKLPVAKGFNVQGDIGFLKLELVY